MGKTTFEVVYSLGLFSFSMSHRGKAWKPTVEEMRKMRGGEKINRYSNRKREREIAGQQQVSIIIFPLIIESETDRERRQMR